MLRIFFGVCTTLALLAVTVTAQDAARTDPLDGKKFRSVEKHERGLGPKGEEHDYWHVAFTRGGYVWDYSDLRSRGLYKYDPKTGVISTDAETDKKQPSKFDPQTGKLLWRGLAYQLER